MRLAEPARAFLVAFALGLSAVGAARAVQAPPLERFTVQSDGHPMTVWARRPAAPAGAILLVHGRTWSSRPDFDLQVPGLRRSVMASLAERGYAAYAVDLRGYGGTPRDRTGWLTPRRSMDDVLNVLAWLRGQHPALGRPALAGWSRGAAVSMLAAQAAPDRMSALIVFGFVFDPDTPYAEAPTPAKPLMLKNTAAAAASDFVAPRVTSRAVIDAFVSQALASDPTTMDLRNDTEFNVLNPARVRVPTLVLFGEHDVNVPAEDGALFFKRLATTEKRLVELPGADHAAQLEDTHEAWILAVVDFVAGRR
jgi:pimeloyl-ACP methyl ester carboxylesterase